MASVESPKVVARSKRTNNACARCRKRKIKCSGSIPCVSCSQKGFVCKLEAENRRVVVSQRYLQKLERAAGLKNVEDDTDAPPADTTAAEAAEEQCQIYQSESDRELTNPLAPATSAYLTSTDGRLRSLGESSTWSFSRKTLTFIRDYLNHPESPEVYLNGESSAYALTWGGGEGFGDATSSLELPSIDHALYLINGVKFHLGQLFHLVDDLEFMHHLHEFYEDPTEKAKTSNIWFVQFFAVLALGKAALAPNQTGVASPPGSDLFIRAMSLMPNPSFLFNDPLTSIEALCSISLYLQSTDERNSAFIYIGQALRMALLFGLHRERPPQNWDPRTVERCQKVWWTVYILDRTFISSQGVPIASIQDHDITAPLPKTDVARENTIIHVYVKLARVTAEVVNKVYGANGRLGASFLSSIHVVLQSIATIANDLNAFFPLSFNSSVGGITRVAGHLHLYYHQAILLALYPLVFGLFEKRIKEQGAQNKGTRNLSETSQALLNTCANSSGMMLRIIGVLHRQSILDSSFPFDLEHTFSALFVSTMIAVIASSSNTDGDDRNRAHLALEDMVKRGSIPAAYRKSELELLESLIGLWRSRVVQDGNDAGSVSPQNDQLEHNQSNFGRTSEMPLNDAITAHASSAGQLLDVARMANASYADIVQGNDWLDSWLWETTPPLQNGL